MKNYYKILFALPLLFATSCTNNSFSYGETYKNDLQKLVEGPWISRNQIDSSKYLLTSNESFTQTNSFLYTIKFNYASTTLENFRVIVLPSSDLNNYQNSNLATIGYNSIMNLVPTRPSGDKNNYPQYKLQIEKKEKLEFVYIGVTYTSGQDLIKINF